MINNTNDTIEDIDKMAAEARDLGLNVESVPDFYDATLDDKNQKHLDKMRSGRASDAILSCPGCFTTICVDCQQHTVYENQFRAMFVMNCKVDTNQLIKPDNSDDKQMDEDEDECDAYNPIHCTVCGVEVGLREACPDGAHIFFNVIASNA